MAENIVEKTQSLVKELENKKILIADLKKKLHESNLAKELLESKLANKETEVNILLKNYDALKKSSEEQQKFIDDLHQKNQNLNKEIIILKDSSQTISEQKVCFYKFNDHELNLVRMQYSDLEVKYLKLQEKIIELELINKNQLRIIKSNEIGELSKKRRKWVESGFEKSDISILPKEETNLLKEAYKRALVDFRLLYKNSVLRTEKEESLVKEQ